MEWSCVPVRVSVCQCGAWPISLRVRMVCWVPETLPFYLGLLSTKRSSTLSGCQEITLAIFRFDSSPEPKTQNCTHLEPLCLPVLGDAHTRVLEPRAHPSPRRLLRLPSPTSTCCPDAAAEGDDDDARRSYVSAPRSHRSCHNLGKTPW